MKKQNRLGKRTRKGQAVVELAILFPFFLLIIIGGIVDFGFAFNNLILLQGIANSTAQYGAEGQGAIGLPVTEIADYAQKRKPSWWSGPMTVSPPEIKDMNDPDGVAYKVVIITISYQSPTFTPFYQTMFSSVTGSTYIPLTAKAAYQIPSQFSVR